MRHAARWARRKPTTDVRTLVSLSLMPTLDPIGHCNTLFVAMCNNNPPRSKIWP